MTDVDTTISTLVDNVGKEVEIRFSGPPEFPSSGYDGISYSHETTPETTIRAKVETAEIDDWGLEFISFITLDHDEVMRLGLNPDAVGNPVEIEIYAIRDEENRDDETDIENLPWEVRPTARMRVEQTKEGARRHVEAGYAHQYMPPNHEIGEIRGVETQ